MDSITGTDGDDTINGTPGDDTIYGFGGNDNITGDLGNDMIDGGDGRDTIYGGDGRDTIYGGSDNDTIYGGSGNDYLAGGEGADYIEGGDGDDIISAGPSTAIDNAADILIGGAGDDKIFAGYGDSVDGGTGQDRFFYDASNGTAGITADFAQLASGGSITVAGATITGVEIITGVNGTNYNDTITVGDLVVLSGDPVVINGLGGDDILTGSSGRDNIRGGTGNDTIRGGDGFDSLSGDEGNDLIAGGAGEDSLAGGDGNDTFTDTAAGLNGDTIVDLSPSDKIIITDATLSGFAFSYSNGTLSYSGGSITIPPQSPGTFVASAGPGGGVELDFQPAPVATNDQIASELISGYWDGDTHRWAVTQGGTLTVNISTLAPAEQALARTALAEWTDIIGVNFQEVTNGGQIVFDDSEDPSGPIAATDASWSGGFITSAHIQISTSWLNQYGTRIDSYGFQTYVHEVGHALGLGHPGNYNFTGTYANDALFLNDSWATSVLSYFDQAENSYFAGQRFSILNAVTPMQADIVAMQSLYGLSTTTRTDDTVYGYNSNAGGVYDANVYSAVAFTILDSGGKDTLDYSGSGAAQLINLNPETFSNVRGYTGNLSIARGTIIENAIGGFASDIIIGNGVDNVLTGNLGNDVFTGGPGADTFKDTAAGLNGDTITDFSVGDKIVITDATLAGFSFSLSGNTLNFTGGSLTLGSVPNGTIVASAAATGGVQLTILPHDVPNDFSGDRRSDIVLRDASSGWTTDWLGTAAGGLTNNGANASIQFPTDWKVAGSGDFNGDGRDDLLLRSDAGWLTNWLGNANGSLTNNGANTSLYFTPDWKVVGLGDFNGDGKSDLLLRSTDGWLTNWLGTSTGSFTNNGANTSLYFTTDWKVAGTGDFNGDGISDLLLRRDDGWLTDWLGTANGGFTNNGANTALFFTTDWKVIGTGDFNGDGISDVLLRRGDGWMTDWLGTSTGGFTNNGANTSLFFTTDWHVASIGDFNGDGRDDVLLRNDSGWTTDWLATQTGSFANNGANFSTFVAPNWQVQDPFVAYV